MRLPGHRESDLVLGMHKIGALRFEQDEDIDDVIPPYSYAPIGDSGLDPKIMPVPLHRSFRRHLENAYFNKMMDASHTSTHVYSFTKPGGSPAANSATRFHRPYLWHPNGDWRHVEGEFQGNDPVIITGETLSNGLRHAAAIKQLGELGLKPIAVVAEFDYEEGGRELLEQNFDVSVDTISSLSRALSYLRDAERIDDSTIEAVDDYHRKLRAQGISSSYNPAA